MPISFMKEQYLRQCPNEPAQRHGAARVDIHAAFGLQSTRYVDMAVHGFPPSSSHER